MRKGFREMQGTSGVHVWLVLAKAFHALADHAEMSLNLSQAGLDDSDFRVLEVLLHKGSFPVNTIGPSMAHTRIDQCRGRSAGEEGAREAEEYRRPARAPRGAHGERPRPHHQDLSGTCGRHGRGRRNPLPRGAADVAATP